VFLHVLGGLKDFGCGSAARYAGLATAKMETGQAPEYKFTPTRLDVTFPSEPLEAAWV
jgi:hypothetical protein